MNKKYLFEFENFKKMRKKLQSQQNILLFLDYDGTLAPFKTDPLKAYALPQTKKALQSLLTSDRYYLNLISGRKLSELKQMLALENLNYAGSHGLEIDLNFVEEIIYPKKDQQLDYVSKKKYKEVRDKYSKLKEIKLEDKGFGLALHFKSEKKLKKHGLELKSIFKDSAYQLLLGRKVLEIRPQSWDKGKTVDFITKKIKSYYQLKDLIRIYIGDDSTDEDAFKALSDGITVYVQNEADLNTKAEYYLKNPTETAELLEFFTGEI